MLLTISSLAAYAGLVGLVGKSARASSFPHRRSSIPPFDGQYATSNSANMQTEWWYAQAVAEPVGNNPPASVVIVFEQGYIFATEPASVSGFPENYVTLSGTFANGTNYNYTIPATSSNVTTAGEAVTGIWHGAGTFYTSSNLSAFTIEIDAPDVGISGTVTLTGNAAHHYPCGDAPDPYFDSVAPAGVPLNPSEQILFHEYAWAVTIPGGNAIVALSLEGAPLEFKGYAYHDHDWSPTAISEFGRMWYWLWAQVGPYDLTGVVQEALNSSLPISSGYLSRDGEVLQNQCSLNGTKSVDSNVIVPYGATTDAATGALVPAGFLVEYTLEDGARYIFNLTSMTTNPDEDVYHRWIGTATGGEVGGEQHSGLTIFEWMNPALVPYTP